MSGITYDDVKGLIDWHVITYDDRTKKMVLPYMSEIDNSGRLKPAFENDVIAEKFDCDCDQPYVAYMSPYFFQKAPRMTIWKIYEALKANKPDVLTFHRRQKRMRVFSAGDMWHGSGFYDLLVKCLEGAGIGEKVDLQEPPKVVVLSNYVIARRPVYGEYVDEILTPFLDYLYDGDLAEEIWKNSNYKSGKRMTLHNQRALAEFRKFQLGVDGPDLIGFYPLHTFLCERLWSAWLNKKGGLKIHTI